MGRTPLHRITVVATGGLDPPPHNRVVGTLPGICGMTQMQALGGIVIVTVVAPRVARALIIALGIAFGSFQDPAVPNR